MATERAHDYMLAWVSLVHAGTFLTATLSARMQEELGVSLPEQDLLSQLDKAGQIRMVELARRIVLSKAGITKMVDRLEAGGLLTRVPSATDRRVTSAALTGKGRALLKRSRTLLRGFVRDNLARRLDGDEIRQLGGILQKLLESHGRWEGQMAHLKGYPDGAP